MTRSDPAYGYFRSDAEAQGFTTLADYFRHYGIVPPANYGRPAYKDREVHAGLGDGIDYFIAHDRPVIDKSWGETGKTLVLRTGRGNTGGPSARVGVGL